MPRFTLWFHPLLQTAVFLLALHVGRLGLKRFRSNHLGSQTTFPWKTHVRLGKAVYALWSLGFLGGLAMAWLHWGGIFMRFGHAWTAVAMLGFMALGLATGLYMDRNKARRTALPLVHAAANLAVLGLAVSQLVTGLGIMDDVLF